MNITVTGNRECNRSSSFAIRSVLLKLLGRAKYFTWFIFGIKS